MPAGMRICRIEYVKNYKSIVSHLTEKGKYLQEKTEYFGFIFHIKKQKDEMGILH